MPDVLTYVLHFEGAFNKNSLGAVSEGAARAEEIGGQCHALVLGGDVPHGFFAVGGHGRLSKPCRGREPELRPRRGC